MVLSTCQILFQGMYTYDIIYLLLLLLIPCFVKKLKHREVK